MSELSNVELEERYESGKIDSADQRVPATFDLSRFYNSSVNMKLEAPWTGHYPNQWDSALDEHKKHSHLSYYKKLKQRIADYKAEAAVMKRYNSEIEMD